jgi:hypothetical protein
MTRMWIGLALFMASLLIALTVPARQVDAQMLAFHSASNTRTDSPNSRIQADLARRVESWQGTRDCAANSRARSAVKPVLAHWLGTQMMAHPGRKLGAWGYHSGDIWAEDRVIDGKPVCSAGFRKLIAYADFR